MTQGKRGGEGRNRQFLCQHQRQRQHYRNDWTTVNGQRLQGHDLRKRLKWGGGGRKRRFEREVVPNRLHRKGGVAGATAMTTVGEGGARKEGAMSRQRYRIRLHGGAADKEVAHLAYRTWHYSDGDGVSPSGTDVRSQRQ